MPQIRQTLEIIVHFGSYFVETFGDEYGYDNIIEDLEDVGNVDGTLTAVLEGEFESSELEVTAEEAVSIFERICAIEWSDEMDLPDDHTEDDSIF